MTQIYNGGVSGKNKYMMIKQNQSLVVEGSSNQITVEMLEGNLTIGGSNNVVTVNNCGPEAVVIRKSESARLVRGPGAQLLRDVERFEEGNAPQVRTYRVAGNQQQYNPYSGNGHSGNGSCGWNPGAPNSINPQFKPVGPGIGGQGGITPQHFEDVAPGIRDDSPFYQGNPGAPASFMIGGQAPQGPLPVSGGLPGPGGPSASFNYSQYQGQSEPPKYPPSNYFPLNEQSIPASNQIPNYAQFNAQSGMGSNLNPKGPSNNPGDIV